MTMSYPPTRTDFYHVAQVVVDFSATWCGPCRMISPYFDELSKDFKSVYFLKVDVDAVEVRCS